MSTKDFQAKQVKTQKLIASGANVGTTPSLLIMSSSDTTDELGTLRANYLSGVGSDVWLYITGSSTNKVLLGGDLVISGTFAPNTLTVGSNLTLTANEIDVASGNLTLDVAGDITLMAN